jgi:hypothetical protein
MKGLAMSIIIRPCAPARRAGFGLVGQVELFQELTSPTSRTWQEGITLHGHPLRF